MSNKQKQNKMETLTHRQELLNSIEYYTLRIAEYKAKFKNAPKSQAFKAIIEGNEELLSQTKKQLNKLEKMESLENLQNLLGQNAEMVISENEVFRVVRVCIMGDQETQHNNNQVLRALGSSTNELRRLCRLSSVQILELMHDDGTLHLTISEESAQRLELEITDTL
jgi:hypothetical protein